MDAVKAGAALVEGSSGPRITQSELGVGEFIGERDSVNNVDNSSESYEQLIAAVKELQIVVWPLRALNRDPG